MEITTELRQNELIGSDYILNHSVQKKDPVMKRFALSLVLAITFVAPVSAFTIDMSMPVLTFPEPPVTTQSCIQPSQIGKPDCSVTE